MIRILLLLIVTSCAHKLFVPKAMLFPYGIYQHQVSLDVDGKNQSFSGVNRWSKTDLTVVALGPFDATLLRYKEDFVKYKKEIYIDRNFIPLSDEQAKLYLSVLRDIYSSDFSNCTKTLCRKTFYGQEFLFDLDAEKKVTNIRFSRGKIKINVAVESYEAIL